MVDSAEGETIIGGRYALSAPLGAGGMASVYIGRLATTGGFARIVAIKRVRRDRVEERLDALLDEARLASRIHHPNVVAPLDMVVADEDAYLVMEFVPGITLAELLAALRADDRRLPPEVACAIVTGVLLGLEAAHQAVDEAGRPLEIVHRDVSPDNVLVGVDGLARLLDFGVAKGRGRLQVSLAGHIKGKIGYTAPEILQGGEAEPASDVYAAAVVLWEALTGERLFEAGRDRIAKIVEADIEPPSSVVASLPRPLNAAVMRGLEPTPETRYPSAIAFVEALERSAIATQRQVASYLSEHASEVLAARLQLMRSVEATGGAVTSRRRDRSVSSTVPEGPGLEEEPREAERGRRDGIPRPLARGAKSRRRGSRTVNFDPANASHTAMVESMGGRWSNAGEAIVQADDPEPDPPSPSPASAAAEPPAAPSPGPTTTPGGPAPKRPGPTRIGLGPEEPSSVHPAKLHLEREAQQAGASAYRPPPPQGAAAPAPSTPPANDEGSELAVPVAPNRAPLMVVAVVLLVAAIAGARFLL